MQVTNRLKSKSFDQIAEELKKLNPNLVHFYYEEKTDTWLIEFQTHFEDQVLCFHDVIAEIMEDTLLKHSKTKPQPPN